MALDSYENLLISKFSRKLKILGRQKGTLSFLLCRMEAKLEGFFMVGCGWHLSQAYEGAAPVSPRRGADLRGMVSQDGGDGCGGEGLETKSRLGTGGPPAPATAWGSWAG